MAERVGFEPTVPVKVHMISSHAGSAALAPLQKESHQSKVTNPGSEFRSRLSA